MPRVSFSNDYLLASSYCFDRHYQISSDDEQASTLSPSEIDEILSRKLYNQLKTTSELEKGQQSEPLLPSFSSSTTGIVDPDLLVLIERFFNLTYLNTIPMVNLLATAVATNFLQENIRELDKKLQEQQTPHTSLDIKRGTSLLYEYEEEKDDDNDLSWASAPT